MTESMVQVLKPIFVLESEVEAHPLHNPTGEMRKLRDILTTGEWLSDIHAAVVNELLKTQFPEQNEL